MVHQSFEGLYLVAKAVSQQCSSKKIFSKYLANLQEKTHAEVRF